MDTVFLKLGGSLITDKSRERAFRAELVRKVAEEVRSALAQRPMRLLLGHGGGGFAHGPARRHRVREGLAGGGGWEGYAVTRRAVIELNGLVLDAFADQGLHPMAVPPSATALARGGRLVSMDTGTVRRLLEAGQIPMVFGDAVLDEERGFTIIGTEGVFACLARELLPARIILACDVDGVFDADPKDKDDAKRIADIDGRNLPEVLSVLGGAGPRGAESGRGADVTGGMAAKVQAAHDLAWQLMDCEIRIVSGLMTDRVREALLGRGGGTRIRP